MQGDPVRSGARRDRGQLPVRHQRARRHRGQRAGQDGRRAAVVAGQPDGAGRREVRGEAQEEADVGAAEGVDGLVRVADRAQVAVRRAEQPQQRVLGRVDVLVLVDADVRPAPPVRPGQLRVGGQQRDRQRQQVVQVDQVAGPLAGPVAGQRAGVPGRRGGGRVAGQPGDQVEQPAGVPRRGRVAERLPGQREPLGLVHHPDPVGQAERGRVAPARCAARVRGTW